MSNNFEPSGDNANPRDSTAFLSDKSRDSDPGFNIVDAEDDYENPSTPSIE
jgi:hypothetical protein